MKKILISLLVVLYTSSAFAQGIEFEHITFDEALAKAKTENKLVFLDCYTAWCGPCKWLAKTIFPIKEVGDYFNKNFVNIKMDMEKGEGPRVQKMYSQINSYPTLLFINSNGAVVHAIKAASDASSLIEEAKKALDPSKRIDVMEAKYESGERASGFMLNYLVAIANQGNKEKFERLGNEYLSNLSNEDLIDKTNFEILRMLDFEYEGSRCLFVKNHKEEFVKVSSIKEVDQYLFYAHTTYVGKLMSKREVTFEALDEALKNYLSEFSSRGEGIARMGYKEYYLRHKMFDAYFNLTNKYIANDFAISNEEGVYCIISSVYGIALDSESKDIEGADEWVISNCERAIKLSPDTAEPYLFLASVYKRQNKKELAVEKVNIYLDKMKVLGMELKHDKLEIVEAIKAM
ncbi:hypothetical protein BZG02_07960 [Labilibaculum filiforme]|uniref:Thioredoxin domain-containing protein n=1 Tax=Labilibaculum filiforme TaxID=1940526 RepID=A0A2N3I0Z8_9BACT|nr:DUF255 domain-containing protein [Labilibaculum filiforme]PKQ63937.1 hypothetical protein BZG02_07960 [Labilibaculum filiforme]